MKIMITGCNGQLGTELIRQLHTGESILGPIPPCFIDTALDAVDIDALDIADEAKVKKYVMNAHPDVVIHCASMTNVDGCEAVPAQTRRVNGESVKHIAQACEAIKAKLVYISTDYVFAGDKGAPYLEDDACNPQSAYGESKRLGEVNAMGHCSRAFVVRTAWLYGRHGHNFVKVILNKGRQGGPLRVVDDQVGCPTNAEDLAYHILKLAATERYGVYHCTGSGVCSWYEFAREIVALAGISCEFTPCTSLEYPQKAKRPAYSVLSHGALDKAVGDEMRPWKEALKDFLDQLEEWE